MFLGISAGNSNQTRFRFWSGVPSTHSLADHYEHFKMELPLQRRLRLLLRGQDRVHRWHPEKAGHVGGRPRGHQRRQHWVHREGKSETGCRKIRP